MMPQTVNHWPVATEAWVQFQVSLCAIHDGQGGTGGRFSWHSPAILYIHSSITDTVYT